MKFYGCFMTNAWLKFHRSIKYAWNANEIITINKWWYIHEKYVKSLNLGVVKSHGCTYMYCSMEWACSRLMISYTWIVYTWMLIVYMTLAVTIVCIYIMSSSDLIFIFLCRFPQPRSGAGSGSSDSASESLMYIQYYDSYIYRQWTSRLEYMHKPDYACTYTCTYYWC